MSLPLHERSGSGKSNNAWRFTRLVADAWFSRCPRPTEASLARSFVVTLQKVVR